MFPFNTPQKTSENQSFFDVFSRYKKGILAWNGLIIFDVSAVFEG